jgi:hypothetical protein
MFIAHVILSLVLAALAVGVLVFGLRRRGKWNHALPLFVVLFLAIWAGGVSIAPFGPPVLDVHWLPFLLTAVLLATLIAAVVPPSKVTRARIAESEHEFVEGLDIFFWILVGALLVIVGARYA